MSSRRRIPGALLLGAAASLAVASPAHAITGSQLRAKLTPLSHKLGSAAGAEVVDLDADGTVLYSRNPSARLAPASNEKLYTTSAALLKFTPTGTLATSVRTSPGAQVDGDGTLHGDLILVGGGDPSLGDGGLNRLVAQLRAGDTPLKKVTGSVRGDDSAFDHRRGSFASDYLVDGDIGGWLGALTWAHGNSTGGGPAIAAAARLQKLLGHRGVTFGRSARQAPADTSLQGPKVATVASPPMQQLVYSTNQPSDNFYAEMLLKDLAMRFGDDGETALGTTPTGTKVVRSAVQPFGVAPTIVDGSGLSRSDRTTPHQLVTLLGGLKANKDAAPFLASLPVAGQSGTLRHRMRGTAASGRCRAKTGTLRGVSALSGYCTAANGHTLAFSLMENRVNAGGAKSVEDRMVPQIAAYSGG